jgi:hypothetical protein
MDAAPQRDSLYRAAAQAGTEYRAAIVGRLGPAHDSAALAEWNRDRFWLWAIERAIEHVEGTAFWAECGRRNFSRASQRPEFAGIIAEIRRLQRHLSGDSLPSFQAKEDLVQQLAELANRLLE